MGSRETSGASFTSFAFNEKSCSDRSCGLCRRVPGGCRFPVSAATVGCSPAALVTALAAVSGSGHSGTVTLTTGCMYTMTRSTTRLNGPNAFPDILEQSRWSAWRHDHALDSSGTL